MKVKKNLKLSDPILEEIASMFAVLADASRLKIIRELMAGAMSVGEIVAATGLKQGNVSKHLALMLQFRLLARERHGNFAYYEIAEKKLYDLCEVMCSQIESQGKRYLERLK